MPFEKRSASLSIHVKSVDVHDVLELGLAVVDGLFISSLNGFKE